MKLHIDYEVVLERLLRAVSEALPIARQRGPLDSTFGTNEVTPLRRSLTGCKKVVEKLLKLASKVE